MSLPQVVNQNSYTLGSLALLSMALVLVAARFRNVPLAWGAFGVLVVVLIAGNLLLRVGAADVDSTAQFDQILAARQPVVLEIYSNY